MQVMIDAARVLLGGLRSRVLNACEPFKTRFQIAYPGQLPSSKQRVRGRTASRSAPGLSFVNATDGRTRSTFRQADRATDGIPDQVAKLFAEA
jgi:hypothetical protein